MDHQATAPNENTSFKWTLGFSVPLDYPFLFFRTAFPDLGGTQPDARRVLMHFLTELKSQSGVAHMYPEYGANSGGKRLFLVLYETPTPTFLPPPEVMPGHASLPPVAALLKLCEMLSIGREPGRPVGMTWNRVVDKPTGCVYTEQHKREWYELFEKAEGEKNVEVIKRVRKMAIGRRGRAGISHRARLGGYF
ncbi:hypothetical protein DENSPDRAFT_883584 [Dentipellis sp. KUC8613]|nr:hypothetical protein DENSPDRAFT_883584 [Dentipellis sp. KUC8613]